MSSLFETIIRADDFLHCQFEFVNLALRTSSAGAQQLERAAAGPAFIIVRLPPQGIAEQVARDDLTLNFPYQAGLSGPSRLAWRLPDSFTHIEYRLDALLAQLDNAELESADAATATVIEFPDRLLLTPQPSVRSAHRSTSFTSPKTGVTEIWHTTLQGLSSGNSSLFKAIANIADTPGAARPFDSSLTKLSRDNIIELSRRSTDPHVVASSLFRLTSLGATAKLKSNWVPAPDISLAAWEHNAELGRDYYVYTLEQGFLFPFGHRATIATVIERKFTSHFGISVAELQSQKVLTVLDVERDYDALNNHYPGSGREMPFARVRVASAPHNIDSNDAPIQLDLVLVDRTGNRINCSAPALFVPVGSAATTDGPVGALKRRYTDPTATSPTGQPVSLALVSLDGQRMAMTANDNGLGDTSFNVESLTFGVNLPSELLGTIVPGFLPFMAKADARIPALEQMVGTTAGATPATQRRATEIEYHPNYLAQGFNGSQHVYAKLKPIPGITIPPERAGGLTAPTFPAIDGLSRLTGPVSKVDGGLLSANDLVKDTKLLGVISLASIIENETNAAPFTISDVRQIYDKVDNNPNLFLPRPVMTTITTDAGVETRFIWKPKIKPSILPPLGRLDNMELVLKGRISKLTSGNSPAFEVNGALRNFELSFSLLGSDVLAVQFDALEFVSKASRKVDLKLGVRGIEFRNKLTFVQKLQSALPLGNLTKGASVQTLPDGVVVSFAVPLPAIPLGLLNIQNVVVSTSVSLSFVPGRPAAVRFALSERNNPFLVSVSIFGGTGFFALEVSTDKLVKIEAALEFGGVASLNLIVVKGGVYLLAGIYLSISGGDLLIEGHIRLGGFVDLLGLISVSIEVFIALTYVSERNVLFGTGRLTVGVKLLFFSESFSFEIKKEIPGFGQAPTESLGPRTNSLMLAAAPIVTAAARVQAPGMTVDQFKTYCSAFA